ncbi:MAG: acetolactate synthase small subunit, partial [Nitrospinae bacterium]|nr:acetolactate synthase small subunit [Nitrospinota bacterium]
KQLRKLYDVREVEQITYNQAVTRELVLATIKAPISRRSEVIQLANAFGAQVINMTDDTVTLEASGNDHKVRTLLKAFESYGISQMARTGMISLPYDGMPEDWEPIA